MLPRRTVSLRLVSVALVLVGGLSCSALNYPDAEPPLSGHGQGLPADAEAPFGVPQEPTTTTVVEAALSWSDLTRLAREHRQRGEFLAAQERLAQAAEQLRDRPPTNAQRRTVFGLRARLAETLAANDELEAANELADELISEAEAEPELGGAALVSLALSVAERRAAEATEAGRSFSPLPLLKIAFDTAQTGPASRDRIGLAFRVSEEASRAKDFDLARRAIDQALVDTRRVSPTDKKKIASFEIYKARIALAQGDLAAAEAAAVSANRIFEAISADSSNRGIAEAALAEVLARKGDLEKALIIVRGARARMEGEEPVHDHARRLILAAAARVERSAGDLPSARRTFEAALAVPAVDFAPDADLVRKLRREIQELDAPRAQVASPPDRE